MGVNWLWQFLYCLQFLCTLSKGILIFTYKNKKAKVFLDEQFALIFEMIIFLYLWLLIIKINYALKKG